MIQILFIVFIALIGAGIDLLLANPECEGEWWK